MNIHFRIKFQGKIIANAIECICYKFGILWFSDDDKDTDFHL